MAVRKYHVINGTLEKRFKPRKFQGGIQMIGGRPQAPKSNVWGDIAEVGVSAASGAGAGAVAGNVPGAIIGGAVGIATGLASVLSGNKEEEAQYQADLDIWKEGRRDDLQGTILDSNQITQQLNQIAKKGVYATGTEEIEVEKNELIFTKTATGKYVLKADFKDGKTHNKGGEDYQAADGDIIFPGKDRKKVMKAYKSQDFPKLESMRMALPKDVDKAKLGFDNTDPKKQYAEIQAQVKAGKLPQSFADDFYARNANAIVGEVYDVSGVDFGDQRKGFNVDPDPGFKQRLQSDGTYKRTSIGLTSDQMIEDLEAATFNARRDNPLIESPDQRPFIGGDDSLLQPNVEVSKITPETPAKGGGKSVNPNANFPSADMISQIVPTKVGLGEIAPMSTFKPGGIDVARATQIGESKVDLPGVQGLPGGQGGEGLATGLGYAVQGMAALTNLFPGEAEVEKSPELRLDRLKYTDTSALLRQQSKVNERVQASNARNVSGGNIQNYLANRKQLGISNLRNQQAINTQEYQRALGISNQNIQIANRESIYNNQLLQRDTDINAANRAARSNIIRAGVGKLGELGGQIGQDAMARKNQALLAEAIGSGQYSAYGQFKGR